MRAVEAMIHGRRLTRLDLARSWPGAERIRAPLKALDRLLSNHHRHAEREHISKAMTRWLVHGNTTYLKPAEATNEPDEWMTCKAMYALATRRPRDFGSMDVARSSPLTARVVLHAKPPKGRKHRNRQGLPARNSNSRKNAQPESEPWLPGACRA